MPSELPAVSFYTEKKIYLINIAVRLNGVAKGH